MKKHMAFSAAVASLLLVGAGCGASQNTQADLQVQTPPGQQGRMEAKTEGSVDADIDSILEGSDSEQEMLRGSESDSLELEADKAELNAYGEGSYEIK